MRKSVEQPTHKSSFLTTIDYEKCIKLLDCIMCNPVDPYEMFGIFQQEVAPSKFPEDHCEEEK